MRRHRGCLIVMVILSCSTMSSEAQQNPNQGPVNPQVVDDSFIIVEMYNESDQKWYPTRFRGPNASEKARKYMEGWEGVNRTAGAAPPKFKILSDYETISAPQPDTPSSTGPDANPEDSSSNPEATENETVLTPLQRAQMIISERGRLGTEEINLRFLKFQLDQEKAALDALLGERVQEHVALQQDTSQLPDRIRQLTAQARRQALDNKVLIFSASGFTHRIALMPGGRVRSDFGGGDVRSGTWRTIGDQLTIQTEGPSGSTDTFSGAISDGQVSGRAWSDAPNTRPNPNVTLRFEGGDPFAGLSHDDVDRLAEELNRRKQAAQQRRDEYVEQLNRYREKKADYDRQVEELEQSKQRLESFQSGKIDYLDGGE